MYYIKIIIIIVAKTYYLIIGSNFVIFARYKLKFCTIAIF